MPNAQGFSSLCRLRAFFHFPVPLQRVHHVLSLVGSRSVHSKNHEIWLQWIFLFFAFFLLFRETASQLNSPWQDLFHFFLLAFLSARSQQGGNLLRIWNILVVLHVNSAWWEFRHHLGNIDKCAKSQKLTQLVDGEIEIISANSQKCRIQSFSLAGSFINFFSLYKYSNHMRGMLSDFAKLDLCCDGECEKTNRISKRARAWIYDRKFPAAKSDLCLDLRSSGSKSYFIIRM